MPKKVVPRLVPSSEPTFQAGRLNDVLPFQLRRAQEASFNAFARGVGDSHMWPGWYSILVVVHDNVGINPTALSSTSRELRAQARLHEQLFDEIVGAENKEALVEILRNLADELNKR